MRRTRNRAWTIAAAAFRNGGRCVCTLGIWAFLAAFLVGCESFGGAVDTAADVTRTAADVAEVAAVIVAGVAADVEQLRAGVAADVEQLRAQVDKQGDQVEQQARDQIALQRDQAATDRRIDDQVANAGDDEAAGVGTAELFGGGGFGAALLAAWAAFHQIKKRGQAEVRAATNGGKPTT